MNGAQAVPLNARLYVSANGPFFDADGPERFSLVRIDGSGVEVPIPFTVEALPWTSSIAGRLRVTPDAPLQANTTYALCHWVNEAPDAGTSACPPQDRVLTFTTGSDEAMGTPTSAEGLSLKVATSDFPDAGPNLFCTGPRRVRGISADVPDAGHDLLYFARAHDAGVFSAQPGSWLPTGVYSPGASVAGVLDCDGKGHVLFGSGWGVPAGTTSLEVWTEDLAGNASAPISVPLQGDCNLGPAPDAGEGEEDGGSSPSGSSSGGSSSGCTTAGGVAGVPAALLLVLAWTRRQRRAE